MNDFYDIIKAANFVHTNVTGLTGDPSIRMIGDDPPSSNPANGEIVLKRQHRGTPIVYATHRYNRFLVTGEVVYFKAGGSSDQTINEMMAEMIRLLDANNESPTRSYDFEVIDEDYNGNYEAGVINFTAECVEWVKTVV
jgi:hypothetical protein